MTRTRGRAAILATLVLSIAATGAIAQTSPVADGLNWLASHQNANGTWGGHPDLVPRDTARSLIALSLHRSTSPSRTAGVAWLGSQRGFEANQFLAEQTLALSLNTIDAGPALARLVQQRSTSAPDYGGFFDHLGDSYDSALALQALATNEQAYTTAIAGVLTTLVTRQNGDGGWGIDHGFDSNLVMTAEVLTALSTIRGQQAPPATIAAAQGYLARSINADGSIGLNVLETAVAFRALALSGYPLSTTAAATLNYLGTQKTADGSWGGQAYLTARVLEAYAANKPNLIIREGDFSLSPAEVTEGGNVTATIKVTNIGAAASAATNVTLYVTDAAGRNLGTVSVGALAAGASASVTKAFAATQLTGTQTILAAVDAAKTIDEMREDDNSATTTLAVAGKPDLQVFSADIVTSPARLQPDQPGTLMVTIRNNGEGEATNAGYAIYDGTGSTETLLKKDAVSSIAAGNAQVVSLEVTLAAGTHAIRVVADPDAKITEANESNNQATKSISVTAAANIDLRITAGSVETAPRLPAAGTAITIWATVANGGGDAVKSTVAFYDGVPGAGGVLVGVAPVSISAGASIEVPINYTTLQTSKVVYAVADPDNLLPELDETNNQHFALLTNDFADLALTRDGFVLPRGSLAQGQSLTSRLVVRNLGSQPATGVQVVIYDDLPQNGGNVIVDKIVDVPALGKVVLEGTWTVRAGQRFATAVVNPSKTLFEPDYANNRVMKLYTATGNQGDIALSGARSTAVDVSGLTVNATTLTASGVVKLKLATPNTTAFTVTVFEDLDGDLAFHPEIDSALGSTLVQPGVNPQFVQISVQGSVRFAPGKLAVHLDSSNAIAEVNESNNLIDLWQDCQAAQPNFKPGTKWSVNERQVHLAPVARLLDTNGDDLIDDNDAPMLVMASRGNIALHRGDTGQRLWIKSFNFSGRQISPAIGDVDNDGKAEIIVHDWEHRLVALNAIDGSRKWTSPNLDRHPDWEFYAFYVDYSYGGAPLIADLDGDGSVEVVSGRTCLRGSDGTIKWVGSGHAGRAWNGDSLYFEFFPDQEAPIATDVNNDGKLEVVAGGTAYRHDGSILWRRGDLPDGYTAPVYLPSQSTPKICLVSNGGIWMLNSDGSTLWGRVGIPGGALLGGAPTVFMDGTTGPWVGIAGDGYYSVFNAATGALRWTKQVTDDFSFGGTATNSATAFDFGGGMTLVYASRSKFLFMRASDGAFMHEQAIFNAPYYPTSPVVADIDGDFRADVVVPGVNTMQVISDPTWRGAPAIFNQASYHVVNVSNDRASIPKLEVQTTYSRTHYRTNLSQALTAGLNPQPNLAASYMRVDTSGFPASVKLTVRVGNSGWTGAVPVKVGFKYLVGTTATLAGTTTSNPLAPGEYQDVTFTFSNPPSTVTGFFAEADSDLAITECNETDNKSPTVSVRLTPDIAIDPALTAVSDPSPARGETIEFLAGAQISSAVDASRLAVQFYLGDPASGGTAISPALTPQISGDAGNRLATVAFTWNVSAPAGPQTVHVLFDPANAIAEDNETNNRGTYALEVGAATGQPDLQVFPTDIVVTPAQLQPEQPATLTITVRNSGKGDATNVVYDIFDVAGATQTLLKRGTIASLPLASSQIVTASISLAGGTHLIRVVVDPEHAIAESNETNNQASKEVDVSFASNVDLGVTNVTATPSRPAAGQSVALTATVTNGGSESVESKVAFYDGVPGAGAALIKLEPVTLAPQQSVTLQATYTATASSKVIYAVADPDDLVGELDEHNNSAYALLTDEYADLVVTRGDISLDSDSVTGGQSVLAQILVRNSGPLAANGVQLVIYDDLPQSGGRKVVDTVVDVPGQGNITVPASWPARAGQRFATVTVNGTRTVFEPNYANNTATRYYTASGDEADLSLSAVDTSAFVVDASKLTITGSATLTLSSPGTKTFTVMVFEDVDGDGAYSPEADFSFGAVLVDAGVTPQTVTVPVSGTLRFAPGKLMVYVDSTNAVSETDETNNLTDLWQLCTTARPNLTASYLRADTSGYPASATFVARVGNNGSGPAVQSGVTFFAVSSTGSTSLGTAVVPPLAPGAYADVQLVVANPSAATTAVYAVADGPALVTECNENDNRSLDLAVQFSSDIVADQALLLVSDPQPRQGDTIDFAAVARLYGAVPDAALKAQFYLGNPSTGGTAISGVLPATRVSSRGSQSAIVEFRWTVTAPLGPQAVYVVFDPANAVQEDDESNNRGIYSLNVSSPDPVRKLSGTISLDPPAAEPGAEIGVSIFIKNIGNVPLDNFTLQYSVSGGAGTGFNGSANVVSLPKSDLAIVTLGKFVPASAGEYTVAVTPSDDTITLVAGPKAIKVAPFAAAKMTATPTSVPISIPLVQAHTKVSRGNTIIVPDDPLVPLLKTHIQRGLNWQAGIITSEMNADSCFRCHVQGQGMVSFEESRKVSGVTVDPVVEERIFRTTADNQWSNGQWHDHWVRRSTTAVGGWALSYWHDSERVKPYLIRSLNGMLELQNSSGSNAGAWECDHCEISYGSREAHTMMGVIALARGYELTRDERYYDSMIRAVNWELAYDYVTNSRTKGQEYAARTSIALSAALPQIKDPALAVSVKNRIETISAFLRSQQNADGSFGTLTTPDDPIIRTAQSLYALSLAGVPGTDASLRAAIVWLLNKQQANGGWREKRTDNSQVHWIDESTWAMIALPAAFLRLGQFDVEYDILLPDDTEFVSSHPVAASVATVQGGKKLSWRFKDVTEAGTDLLLNVKLNGIANNEQRPVAARATLRYEHPYTGEATTRDLEIPLVTGFAPLRLSIATDKPSYASSSPVEITEVIENVGTTTNGVTNDVVIRDENGTTVAAVATNDVVDGLPPDPFPAWNYVIPVSTPSVRAGVNRTLIFDVDFAARLAALGVAGTFDTSSIRVTADLAPAAELFYRFEEASTSNPAAGKLFVTIPDSAPANAPFAMKIFFDILENGAKPVSMFDRGRVLTAINTTGLVGSWYVTDQTRTHWNVMDPSEFVPLGGPYAITSVTNTHPGSATPPGTPADFWFTIWTGAIYIPTAGTYQFRTETDDGSWLDIDGVRLLSNPGAHGVITVTGSRFLTAGFHEFRYTFYEVNFSHWLRLWWAPPGKSFQAITGANLFPAFPAADEATVTVGAAQQLVHGTVTRKFVWNTGTTSAGPYSVLGTLKQLGTFVTDAAASFSITPAANVTGAIVTDKAAYDSGETVRITANARYDAGNVTLTNLQAIVSVLDASSNVMATATTPIASLVPGQSAAARLDWPAGRSAPGSYTARLVVRDSSGVQVAEASAAFELRSTAVTGKGLTGTITTAAVVHQGEPLPIAVSITNGGNSALTDAPFAVLIVDPASGSAAATLNFTASIDAGATFATDLSHSTTGMPVQTYQAYLVSMITGSAVPLSNTTFEVKPPPLKLEISIGGPARVLIWADCANGNSAQPCIAVAPPFITKTLTDAGIPWTLAGTQDAALAALRTGGYDEVILYQKGPYEAKIFAELGESVRSGLGLLLIKATGDALPQMDGVLGTKFNGKLNAASTLLDILDTPLTSPKQITLNGDGVKITLDGARAAAMIAATQQPAISFNTFGAGRVVVIPFDLELTSTADAAKLVVDAVGYVARTNTFDARQVVPIDLLVTPPPGAPANLTIGFTLPEGMSLVYASPELSSTAPAQWNVTANGEPFHLYLWVRLPDAAGTYTITGTAGFAGQLPVVTKTLELEVTADRAAIEAALTADLDALAAAAPSKDSKSITEAQTHLSALKAMASTDAAAAIARILELINALQSVSIDTTAARNDADRLLVWWQSRA